MRLVGDGRDQHAEEPPVALRQGREIRRRVLSQQERRYASIRCGSSTWSSRPQARRRTSSCGPAGARRQSPRRRDRSDQLFAARVDVVELEAGLVEERRERDAGRRARDAWRAAPRPSPSSATGPPRGCSASTISLATRSSSMWQPAGRNGKPRLDLLREVLAAAAEQRPEAPVEPELRAMAGRRSRAPCRPSCRASAQSAAELLQEERRAVGRAQQQQRVDGGHVDALVEEVDGEDDVDAPRRRDRRALPDAPSSGLSAHTAIAAMPASRKTRAMKRRARR